MIGTLVAWIDGFTVVAYLLAAGLCWWRIGVTRSPGRPWRLGLAMTLTLLLLGVNKHFSFHGAVTQAGRQLAREFGAYANHRLWQALFLAAILAVVLALLAALLRLRGHLWSRYRLAVAGMLIVTTLLVVRTVSLHYVDAILYAECFGFPYHAMIELTGLACVLTGAGRLMVDG